MTILRIPQSRFEYRQKKFVRIVEKLELQHFIITNPISIYYLTGFSMIPTERPFLLVFKDSTINFFVPELEKQHVLEDVPSAKYVESYFEYPDVIHPMTHFKKFIREDLKISNKLGAEGGGARGMWGYQGPRFKDALKMPVAVHPEVITDMRIIKDSNELACIRESARWGNIAHQLLQEYTAVGENEIDVSFQASHEASKQMRETLGSGYFPVGYGARPCGAGYRGQIGPYSAIPHAMTRNAIFQKGDTLVTGATGNVAGYKSELERTMFMGDPNEKQRGYFAIMMKAQQAAFDTLGPEVPLSKVDHATRMVFKEAGVMDLVQHHTGHAIGLEGHERPFLDIGMNNLMKAGMVFTVEPGIYDGSIGGFRHSDTVVITEEGIDIITVDYPRDLDSLIIER
ncbi:MAG: aminopeptidase P family protein [Candidatus Heimdallarchaeota archaeon]|nr:MAG: aminopeptidase P family protein [Candidatus Heimdallarchaeota archaeon]